MVDYQPPQRSTGRRRALYTAGFFFGVPATLFCIIGVNVGLLPPTPTDVYMTVLMLPALFTPWAALLDNPGEKRTRVQKLAEFSFCWVLLSGIAQTFWELPWFIFDLTGVIHDVGPDDRWAWLWWTYGGADTRYISSNPTIAGVEFAAGLAGPFELLAAYWFKTGKRIAANWLALGLGIGLTWGTIIFFYAEIHVGFVNVAQGSFGFWGKWFGLNLPWALAPLWFIPGSILELRELYMTEGARAERAAEPPAARLEPVPVAAQ